MKKLGKILSLLCVSAMSLTVAASCAGKENNGTNNKPVLTGVKDLTCEAQSEINVLAGVTATDEEDGDLTTTITVESSPALSFTDGKATPPKAGDYELTYSITDKGGATTEAYATLTVTKQTAEATVYKNFKFDTQEVTDNKGWEAKISDEAEATATLKDGAYVLDIANPGSSDDKVMLTKMIDVKPADYRLRVWARSTKDTYMHMIAKKDVEGWETYGGDWNKRITSSIAPFEIFFTVGEEGRAELRLHFGKITPNGENPTDTTPENFSVIIDKIELYEIVGAESNVKKYSSDFTAQTGLAVNAGDGASAEASYQDGKGIVTINSYPTDGGVWSIKAELGVGETQIEKDKKYYYTVKLTSEKAQAGECLFESASLYHEKRANFQGFALEAGKETELTAVFTAGDDISDAIIRFQIGNPSDGVTSNVITISSVEFGTVEGDKEVTKTNDNFIAFGNGTANGTNAEYPWMTFNGSDEENEGVGTIWTKDGKLYYRIDQGGSVDWYNKLICGYRENPLTLEADSYYTVEIKAKADKAVSCGFFLNPIGNWDPRISEGMDLTTQEKTFTFTTTQTLITDMDFEMLFQFGSAETKELGDVTIEISSIVIYQTVVL